MTSTSRTIHGRPVVWEANGYSIVATNDGGYILYASWRLGEYRTLAGAIRRAENVMNRRG